MQNANETVAGADAGADNAGASGRLINLIEAGAVFAGQHYFSTLALALAAGAGIVLPDQPVLKHTYLLFVFVLIVMLWLKLRGEIWSAFGLIAPKRWGRYLVFGLLLAVGMVALDQAVRSVTTPIIVAWTGANPHLDAEAFAALKGNFWLTASVISTVWVYAAFGEEFLFRGYLLTRLAQIFGGGQAAWTLAVIGQAIAFALAHAYQGPVGMVPIGIGALVSGTVVSAWGRNLWPVMVAHGLIDTLGLSMFYLGQTQS